MEAFKDTLVKIEKKSFTWRMKTFFIDMMSKWEEGGGLKRRLKKEEKAKVVAAAAAEEE